jgi:AraC family transcriptional regulator
LLRETAGRYVELAEELGAHDPLLEQLLLALDATVQRGAASSRLYVDSLGVALAAQLVERHGAGRPRPVPAAGAGLADREWDVVVEVLHDRLAVGVSLAELAATVGRSPSQFARAFKLRTGLPPHRYLMRLRLEHAQRLLRTSALSLAQVAAESGFAHQEHLTRVMRDRLSTTPGALRAAR